MGLSPSEMQDAIIKNLPSKTGKTLEEWLVVAGTIKASTDKDYMSKLKTDFALGHFQAQTILKHFKAHRIAVVRTKIRMMANKI